MAFLQWRRFNFFDKEILKDETNVTLDLLKKCQITCSSSGNGHIIVGDSEGNIHVISRHLNHSSFRAYNIAVTHCHQLVSSTFLVTIGVDEPQLNPVIKIWNQEKLTADGVPHCSRVVRASIAQSVPSQVTALDVLDTMMMMCIGFADGNLMLFRGDITREKTSKQKIIKCSSNAVTAVYFRNNCQIQSSHKQIILFVSTTKEILSYNVSTRDKEIQTVIDNFGCDVKCCCLKDDPKQLETLFIVGRKDAIYFYQIDERGPCLAFEGEKLLLYWFKSYLIVIGKETSTSTATSKEKTMPINDGMAMNIITIYDISRKFIAYSSPVPAISQVFGEWGSLYLLTTDGRLIYLREKDIQTKLDTLFKKNQFSLAIDLAKSQQYDEDALADIFKQYGDHLYKKGDHDAAIAQYIHTIGRLEASYVIRKFLDAQRIHNLTAYLQALHKAGLANEDHTTLLLNCYAKLKDTSRLDEFLKSNDCEKEYDVEIAIKVLRQAGYYEHALYLADKHKCHDWALRILLEDKCDANAALDYMRKIDWTNINRYMKKYGRLLVTEQPDKTTELLKSLCTDYKSSEDQNNVSEDALGVDFLLDNRLPDVNLIETHSKPEDFIHIFVKNAPKLIEFLEFVVDSPHIITSAEVYNTLLELYLSSYKNENSEEGLALKAAQIMKLLKSSDAKYDVEQAMILCQMNHFDPGMLYLYERVKLFKQILNYYIENSDQENVLKTCEQYGIEDTNLWIDALWYFSSTDETEKLKQVLKQIETNQLLPPIMIIDILSQSGKATLEVIKDYLIRWLTRENEQIQENEKLINQFKDDTENMRLQIEEMKTCPKVFQATKCCGCNHPLELPSVHFLCGHSYHQHCFESYAAENDSDCPLCLPENRKILSQIRSLENIKNIYEVFSKQLHESDDPFSILSNYFSQGIFTNLNLVAEEEGLLTTRTVSPPKTLNLQQKY